MKFCVASIEDNVVRLECESGPDLFVEVYKMPQDIREGSILIRDGDSYFVDDEATKMRKKEMHEKFNRLFQKK